VRIKLSSIHVDDQDKARRFYTEVLGFEVSVDVPAGEYRWIALRSPEGGGAELVLEPDAHPAARAYTQALLRDGIPITGFEVDDVDAEFTRLTEAGVVFTQQPTTMGPVRIAVFSDTCGNLLQIYQPVGADG